MDGLWHYQGNLLGKARLYDVGSDSPLKLRSKRLLALLAYLSENGQPVSREFLIDLLWTEDRAPDAKPAFRVMLSKLRQKMPDVLLSEGNQLSVQAIHWDTQQVMAWLAKADEPSLEQAHYAFQPFMSDFYLEASEAWHGWLEQRRLHWLDIFASINRRLFDFCLHHAKHADYIRICERWLAFDPWREEAHEHYLQILLSDGQEEAARVHLQRYGKQLEQEFGASVSETLQQWVSSKKARQVDEAQHAPAYQLIHPINAFVGREHELVTLRRLSHEHRLVTILGMGGSGKTALALEFAQQQQSSYPQGSAFIALESSQPENFSNDIATALGIHNHSHNDLLAYFKDRHMLLILDNMEHLLAHVTEIKAWLEHAPQLHIVCTSRQRLNLLGEQLLQLTGLEFPDFRHSVSEDMSFEIDPQHYSALRLFEQRARLVNADFSVEENIPLVLEVMTHLEGLPLAIELTASWLGMLSLQQLSQLLQHDMAILSQEAVGLPARHHSLQASLQLSWQQLSATQQQQLTALAVFQGSFSVEAALGVTAVPLNALRDLHYASLLQQREGRYHWHPLVHQFVQPQLATLANGRCIHQAYIAYYADFVAENAEKLGGYQENNASKAITRDIANIRQVLRLMRDPLDTRIFALATELFNYWLGRSQY